MYFNQFTIYGGLGLLVCSLVCFIYACNKKVQPLLKERRKKQEKRALLYDTTHRLAMLLQAAKGGNTLVQAPNNYKAPTIDEETLVSNTVSSYQLPNEPQLS